ncbi:MAG: hypothetical protein NVSMB62_21100 [Acidobacteriaceae bacterium]
MLATAGWPGEIASLSAGKAQVGRVTLLENEQALTFAQTPDALMVTLPARAIHDNDPGYVLRIEGSFPLGSI